jgi:hypothetical protein
MKFRKKPVVIEAIQWRGDNLEEAYLFCPDIIQFFDNHLSIFTQEGVMICALNDWIIRGIVGEFYPCKPDIFEQTYDPVYE